jgi:hypothetical protein
LTLNNNTQLKGKKVSYFIENSEEKSQTKIIAIPRTYYCTVPGYSMEPGEGWVLGEEPSHQPVDEGCVEGGRPV